MVLDGLKSTNITSSDLEGDYCLTTTVSRRYINLVLNIQDNFSISDSSELEVAPLGYWAAVLQINLSNQQGRLFYFNPFQVRAEFRRLLVREFKVSCYLKPRMKSKTIASRQFREI